jgi:SagB-type dehydrogenase family enzyme
LWLSWQESVSLSACDGKAIVSGPETRLALQPLAPEIVAAMQRLAPPGEDKDRLEESILAAGDVVSLARWFYHVNQFRQRGLIRRSLYADGVLLATLVPLGRSLPLPPRGLSSNGAPSGSGQPLRAARSNDSLDVSNTSYVLSRFSYIRRDGGKFVIESPLAHARVIVHDALTVAVVGFLGTPATADEIAGRLTEMAPGAISGLVSMLFEAGMIDAVTAEAASSGREAAPSDSARELALESWEFHDLLFHARSRRGRSDSQFGGTYRLSHIPPPPALKPPADADWCELYRPDLKRLERDDPPLARVQEQRRSLRRYGALSMTVQELGEFLYRVGRLKRQWQADASTPSGPMTLEFTEHPYPAGGGLYELDFYTVIADCRDLAPGLYHYEPQTHRLAKLCGTTRDVESLLYEAAASAGIARETLQVLILLTARFQRLAWKYESIAYSLTLKHVGVVYQTMYLAATAMDLAPCALGCGDSDLFARAAGTDYYAETSVGEFLLGSKE